MGLLAGSVRRPFAVARGWSKGAQEKRHGHRLEEA